MEAKMSRAGRLAGLAAVAAVLAVAAAACTGGHATPETIYITLPPSSASTTAGTSADASGSAAVTPTPAAIAPTVSSQTITQAAPDGRWTVSLEKPIVGGVPTGAGMSATITTKVNAYISTFTSGLPAVEPGDGPSTLDGSYSVAYVSPTLLSLRFAMNEYVTGAAHPVTYIGSINFNVLTGAVIQLPSLFTSTAAGLPVLTNKAHALLTAALGEDLFWPATITMDQFAHAWVFTAGGLEVGWDQGDMAPMAAGPVTVVIPWPQLKTVIANPGPAAGFVAP